MVSPSQKAQRVLDLFTADEAVTNIVHLPGAAKQPEGDVILCDVAREDASIVLGDLKEMGIDRDGSIAMEAVDVEISDVGDKAEHAAEGMPGDAVIWEQVASRTTDNTELNWNFVTLIVMAGLIGEEPRLAEHREAMEKSLSQALGAPVSVKATTNEGMGWIGRGEGLACTAVALVESQA